MRRAALFLLLFAFPALAQLKEQISVGVVEVPVTVVDRAGNPVRGLTKDNFRVLDDGQERAITAFDTIDLAAKGGGALDAINPAARRNFLLLFDLSFTSPRSLANAQEAATNFVKKSVLPRDRVAVATIDLERGFKLLTTFTSDRDLIALAIHTPAGFKSGDPLQLSNESKVATLDTSGQQQADMTQLMLDSGQLRPGELDGAERKADNSRLQAAEANLTNNRMQHSNDAYLRARVEKEVSFLGELAKTLRAVPGRKQIVFLSDGFDSSIVTGQQQRQSTNPHDNAGSDPTLGNQAVFIDSDQHFGSSTSQKFLNEMVKFFRGSDVVLHAIDTKGVRVQNSMEGSTVSSASGLGILTSPTGGTFFQNSNDLAASFERMLHAQEVVYVLTFRATPRKAGDFHELKVKLVKVPGNPQVSARSGYWEAGGESREERTLSAAEIILNDVPQDGLKVEAFTVAFPTSGANAQVPVVLEIPGGDLVGAARSEHPSVEVYIYAFDDQGGVKDRIFQRISLDLAKLKERLFDAGLKFVATLSVPPGRYAVRSLVRVPESERKGFVRSDLVVPERSAVAMLRPVFIDANPSWVTIRGASHTEAPFPFHLGTTEFVPAATARIRSGETPQFAVFVQNATPDDVTIDTTPKAKLTGVVQGDETSAFVLQIDELPPSVAKVDVTLRKKGTEAAQTVSVRVEP